MENQIKSMDRVNNFGEVYTNKREVDAMLDLVNLEFKNIGSTFLEPAAGNGNFLIEILKRKTKVVKKRYRKNQYEYERYIFLAVSSIYGIDILEDNVNECRERLYKQFDKTYTSLFKENCSDKIRESIKYILSKNILCGNGLNGLKDGSEADSIMFSEWKMIGTKVKRKDYAMNDLIAFSDLNTIEILKPRKENEYPLVDIKEVIILG